MLRFDGATRKESPPFLVTNSREEPTSSGNMSSWESKKFSLFNEGLAPRKLCPL